MIERRIAYSDHKQSGTHTVIEQGVELKFINGVLWDPTDLELRVLQGCRRFVCLNIQPPAPIVATAPDKVVPPVRLVPKVELPELDESTRTVAPAGDDHVD